MSEFINTLLANPIVVLFAILAIGTVVGQLSWRNISLGNSAILFVALVFGHYGFTLPPEISALGVVLFVYAVGLQAGPRFFKSFRQRGLSYAVLAIATLVSGVATAILIGALMGIDGALAAGLFTGAKTTTPGLAAALEATGKNPLVSVGYGIAYPFGVLGVVLFAQLLPRLLGIDLVKESEAVVQSQAGPKVEAVWLEVRNPQLSGRTVEALANAGIAGGNIARLARNGEVQPVRDNTEIHLGDYLKVVAQADHLAGFEITIGPRVEYMEPEARDISSFTVFVTEQELVGRSLRQLRLRDRFGVTVTRHWRDDTESVPGADTTLEFGDVIRIVGSKEDCERFIPVVGHQERRLQETNFLPLLLGLLVGVAVGMITIPFPGGGFKLGAAGGPLLVALLAAHYGRLGPLSFRMPLAAKYFIRELGLIFFLAGAGTVAGANFIEVVTTQGPMLFLAGAAMTIVPMSVAYFVARRVMKMDVLSTLGAICGAMTSTPGLGAVCNAAKSDYPAVPYASVYPVALILVTILAKLIPAGVALLGG